ncbi:hypothetical protein F5I97DRAFT_2075396 [Phlebopus sp. FC_14]|nr:hypothetical protein F5I97DRAFT_2075396 [Phlebopus sp. FC_14]
MYQGERADSQLNWYSSHHQFAYSIYFEKLEYSAVLTASWASECLEVTRPQPAAVECSRCSFHVTAFGSLWHCLRGVTPMLRSQTSIMTKFDAVNGSSVEWFDWVADGEDPESCQSRFVKSQTVRSACRTPGRFCGHPSSFNRNSFDFPPITLICCTPMQMVHILGVKYEVAPEGEGHEGALHLRVGGHDKRRIVFKGWIKLENYTRSSITGALCTMQRDVNLELHDGSQIHTHKSPRAWSSLEYARRTLHHENVNALTTVFDRNPRKVLWIEAH